MQINKFPWAAIPSVTPVSHTVVIGGGLAGFSVAYALTRRGMRVTLLESQSQMASGASGNPAGLLMPYLTAGAMPMSDYFTAGCDYTLAVLNELKALGIKVPGEQSGLLYLSNTEALYARHLGLVRAHGNRLRVVDQNEASDLAGVTVNSSGVWLGAAGWVVPPLLCQALREASGTRLSVKFDSPVLDLQYHDRWRIALNQEYIEADAVVIANAEQAIELTICKDLPIQRAPGQLTISEGSVASKKLKLPLCADGYVLPAYRDSQVFGATFRTHEADTGIKDSDHEWNFKQLQTISHALYDDLKTQAFSGRVAVRAVTADHLPLVGPLADKAVVKNDYAKLANGATRSQAPSARYLPHCYVNLAHGARGLSSCLLAGEIIASVMHNETLPVAEHVWRAIHPSRYWFRAMQRRLT